MMRKSRISNGMKGPPLMAPPNGVKPKTPILALPGMALILLSGVLFSARLDAQEALRLSPDEAVKRAIESNLGLESSRTSTTTKKRASDLSWNQFIPSVTMAGSLLRDNAASVQNSVTVPILNPSISGMPININGMNGNFVPPTALTGFFVTNAIDLPQWHIAGTIQASLNISVAMFENMNRLRIDYQGGLLSYEKAKAQLERDVRKAYYNMLLLQENINLLRLSYANVERQVAMAQANYNAGLAPELTLLQARVSLENLRPTIDQAENGRKLSMAQFAMYLGLDYDTAFELIPIEGEIDFIPLDVAELIKKAATGKPEIQELRQSILLLRSARKAQTLSLLPSLSLNWNTTSAFIKDPWKDPWFDGKDDWKNSGSLTISLGLRLHSLIPFSMDFQGIKSFDDQIKAANTGLAQLVRGTEIEIYSTVLSLEKTRLSAETQAQTVDLAQRAYRLTEQAYQAGLQDLFQVQSAELSLRQARVQMLEQQFNYLNGLIDLEYSIGVPFGALNSKGSK